MRRGIYPEDYAGGDEGAGGAVDYEEFVGSTVNHPCVPGSSTDNIVTVDTYSPGVVFVALLVSQESTLPLQRDQQ
jgi:hypothetical protein